MSKQNYYFDAYTIRFEAKIIERVQQNGRTAVILDETYFYPDSGGQPPDTGRLNDVPVSDVSIREADGAVLHWLGKGELWKDEVNGEIDWPRRFDHMQQHTVQHILSQAFIQAADAPTVSFHLSDNRVTIDLDTETLTAPQLEQAEFMANQIIWQNRAVRVRMVTPAEAEALPLRSLPPARNGRLRLIEIEKFDLTACGGTHVNQAGEVGLIKIVRLERQRGKMRVEFCCGQRALRDYRQKNGVINHLTNTLTTGIPELVPAVEKLQAENKAQKQQLKRQTSRLSQLEAEWLLNQAVPLGKKCGLITHVFDAGSTDPGQMRIMANHITAAQNVVVLLGLAGDKTHLLFARAEEAPGMMNQLIKSALQQLDGGGGGSPAMAQGGGKGADIDQVASAIARASRFLQGQVE